MQVICLHDEAFYALLDEVLTRIKSENGVKEDKWISGEEAMQKLRIGKTTLQKYRDEGRIRFTQPDRKTILYDNASLDEFLEKHSREPF